MLGIAGNGRIGGSKGGTRADGLFTRNDVSAKTAADGYSIEDFLGPMDGTGARGSMRADDVLSHETWNQDKYYEGRSLHLTNVLDFLILEGADFWCSEKVLPWAQTDELHVQWNVFKFDRTIADIEPHQGVPRLVTASQESRNASLIRRGLAFMIEHGFYNTARGREHFMMNLRQITDAVHTTCYADVLAALLRANNYYKEWQKKFGKRGGRPHDVLLEERRRWSIVSKSERGFYLLDADIKAHMAREGVKPTTWIFPQRMGIYMSMVPDSEVIYNLKGPKGPENLEKDRYKITTFRGCEVYESIPFDIDFTGAPVSLLTRPRMIGEWFYVFPGKNVHIYSADHDRFVKISYEEALAAAYNDTERERPARGPESKSDEPRSIPFRRGERGEPVAGAPPILIFRPFQAWQMSSAIILRGGSETGCTYHGHHDMQLQNDAIRKILVGHYTFYSRALVKVPKHVAVVEDVFAEDYISGEGVEFFKRENGDGCDFLTAWQNGDIGTDRNKCSLISWVCEDLAGESEAAQRKRIEVEMPDCIDLMGDFDHAITEQMTSAVKQQEKIPGYQDLIKDLNLDELRPQRDAVSNNSFLRDFSPLNTVMFRGMQWESSDGGDPVLQQLNSGHWGKNVYSGCREHRTGRGGEGFLKAQGYKVAL